MSSATTMRVSAEGSGGDSVSVCCWRVMIQSGLADVGIALIVISRWSWTNGCQRRDGHARVVYLIMEATAAFYCFDICLQQAIRSGEFRPKPNRHRSPPSPSRFAQFAAESAIAANRPDTRPPLLHIHKLCHRRQTSSLNARPNPHPNLYTDCCRLLYTARVHQPKPYCGSWSVCCDCSRDRPPNSRRRASK